MPKIRILSRISTWRSTLCVKWVLKRTCLFCSLKNNNATRADSLKRKNTATLLSTRRGGLPPGCRGPLPWWLFHWHGSNTWSLESFTTPAFKDVALEFDYLINLSIPSQKIWVSIQGGPRGASRHCHDLNIQFSQTVLEMSPWRSSTMSPPPVRAY